MSEETRIYERWESISVTPTGILLFIICSFPTGLTLHFNEEKFFIYLASIIGMVVFATAMVIIHVFKYHHRESKTGNVTLQLPPSNMPPPHPGFQYPNGMSYNGENHQFPGFQRSVNSHGVVEYKR